MTLTSTEIASLDSRRRKHAGNCGWNPVIDSWTDPETGAGWVLTNNKIRKLDIAHFFRPRAVNRVMVERAVTSAHERIGLSSALRKILADEKAAKVAPHDLAIGDIIARSWGVTMRDADFYRVTSVPHPRKVRMAAIPKLWHSGDWMAGTVVPDETVFPSDAEAREYKVSMASGRAEVERSSTIERIYKWDGMPMSVHSD